MFFAFLVIIYTGMKDLIDDDEDEPSADEMVKLAIDIIDSQLEK